VSAAIRIEPPRFAMTGAGVVFSVPLEFYDDVLAYSIDAPEFIARGGLRTAASQLNPGFIVASELRS
jgi:hypothetical protein